MGIPESINIPLEFCIRVIASVVVFALIAAAAAGLHVYISHLESNRLLDQSFLYVFKLLEYGILIYDVVCFSFILIVEGLVFGRDLLKRAGFIQ